MEFKGIQNQKTFLLVGMSFYGDPFDKASSWNEDNAIGELWKRFNAFLEKSPDAITHQLRESAFYEVHMMTEHSIEKGLFDIFAGVMVDKLKDIPLPCVAKQLPKTDYAVFTLHGQEITSDWQQDILNWLPSSEYEIAYDYSILRYDERFKGMHNTQESEMDVFIPIRIKK